MKSKKEKLPDADTKCHTGDLSAHILYLICYATVTLHRRALTKRTAKNSADVVSTEFF